MLQNADILLMDEPTNHLDVMNVTWVKDYIKSLTNVTCIMVSHDSGLLNDVCNHILEIADLKLSCFKGNLAAFVKVRPEARAYFELKSNKLKFHFPALFSFDLKFAFSAECFATDLIPFMHVALDA